MRLSGAEENLLVIRTLMERAAVYRRALMPIMFTTGLTAMVAAVVGLVIDIRKAVTYSIYWSVICVIVLIIALALTRRRSTKERQPFWTPPAKRVVHALSAPLVAGAIITVWCVLEGFTVNAITAVWLLFYGCALHTAGFFTPRGLRKLGWCFIAGGAIVCDVVWSFGNPLTTRVAHLAMGACFGGIHLVYGIFLYSTPRRSDDL